VTGPLLEVRGVTKRYGPVRALRGVDLTAAPGECVALLGANGAGKSTLLRVIAGLARPTSGRVLLQGKPAEADGAAWRRRLGHVSHHLMLHEALTARENLRFSARLHGVEPFIPRAEQILRSLGLQDRADEPVRQLSRGLQQRAAIARALLHDPEILLLDEPFTGLDQRSGAALSALLATLRRKHRLLVLVTHDLARAAELATRVVHVRGGKIVHDGPADGMGLADLEALLEGTGGAEDAA
jgi:heme exporter protein A